MNGSSANYKHDTLRLTSRFSISTVTDTNGAGAAAIRATEHHGGVLGDTGWSESPREAGLQSASGVSADGGHGITQLHILVPRGANDKLRQRARRPGRAEEERLAAPRGEGKALARRELHVFAEQRQVVLHHDTRDRRWAIDGEQFRV